MESKVKEEAVLEKLSANAKIALRISQDIAIQLLEKEVNPVHLFLGLIHNKQSLAARTFESMKVDIGLLTKHLVGETVLEIEGKEKHTDVLLTSDVATIIRDAYVLARKFSHVYVGSEHVVLAILNNKELDVTKKLKEFGITYQKFESALLNFASYPIGILAKPDIPAGQIIEQSALSVFGTNLVKLAKDRKLDPVIGREVEIEKIINILSRRKKNNPLLVGESGVGKTVLVEGLAQRIADGNVPQSLKDASIYSLDVSSIMAGSKMRGDIEEKMMAIIREVSQSPNTILFIDEIHNVLNTSSPMGPSDFVGVLKPALTQGEFRCIGATTYAEYTKYIEEDNAMVRRFQPVLVEETSILETVNILKKIKPILEAHHKVKISNEAIKSAVILSDRYVGDRYLPDKAIDLLDEAAASRRIEVEKAYASISDLANDLRALQVQKENYVSEGKMQSAQRMRNKERLIQSQISDLEKERSKNRKGKEYEVSEGIIRSIISKWTGIPVTTLGGEEKSSLLHLESVLSKYVVGQPEATHAVADAIKRARVGISSEDRPWSSFLFLGPTGVGKSELAKILTRELFGDEDRLIRIDMSELMEMHSVSKLIGSPPGYVGYREGGQLTEKIRQQPHSVILFDEIEKAHPDVLNILLQILEYGSLTDGKGRRVNFKNTVVILTSNIGAEEIRRDKILGFVRDRSNKPIEGEDSENAYASMKETLMKELKNTLRPELLNRLDDIVIFKSLTTQDAEKILDLLIVDLNKRLRNIRVEVVVDESLKKYIIENGFSDEYGARPLRRMLAELVETNVANYLLENENDSSLNVKKLNLSYLDKIVIEEVK